MAWYNLNSTDTIVSEFNQKHHIDRCGFCGEFEKKIRTTKKIYFSEFEVEERFSPLLQICLLYTSPSPRDRTRSRMPSSA